MAGLPLIVAGPILRRVEPRLVCVWVALSQPSAMVLRVYSGRQQTGTGDGMFPGDEALVSGAANTVRLGEHLHLGVVIADVAAGQPLTPGQNFSYNVAFGPFVNTGSDIASQAAVLGTNQVTPTADLKSLKLLRDGVIDERPHLALGYQAGELPGFALPPAELTNLRLLHGSCRRPAYVYPEDPGETTFDGLAWVDDLILKWRTTGTQFDANVRPHQLFLTGDQIYADDVASPMLPMLNRLGEQLIGRVERLPTKYPPNADEPSKEAYLGVPTPHGFATVTEFVNTMRQHDRNAYEALQDDRRVRVVAEPALKRRFHMVYGAPFAVDPAVETGPDGTRLWPGDLRHFPAALRFPVMDTEARFSSSGSNQLVTFGEYCAMYLAVFSNVAWSLQDGQPALATIEEVFDLPLNDLPQLWDLHACVPDTKEFLSPADRTKLMEYLLKKQLDKDQLSKFARSTATLKAFYDSLPRVRRALANIPTYMIFDDHDVTDDWNLSRPWRDRVHSSPLGRRVLTSALVTYALFQDWGNDPKSYWNGVPRKLIEGASRLFPSGTAPTTPPAVMDELAAMLSLNQSDPEQPPPALRWDFTIDGPRHRVVVLDTRTRRHFPSRHLPPGLLSPEALDVQLPDPVTTPLPAGIEVLVVVSQTPVVLPAIANSVIMPLTAALKISPARDPEGALAKDNEIWPGEAKAYERLLERLAGYQRVVILSGEVHFGFSGQLTYWSKGPKRLTLPAARRPDLDGSQISSELAGAFQTAGFPLDASSALVQRPGNDEWLVVDPVGRKTFLVRNETDGLNGYEELEPARLAQFTSSGLKNVDDDVGSLANLAGLAFTLLDQLPAERLVWKDSTPPAVTAPAGTRFPPAVRGRVSGEPVLLPTGNWPAGTTMGQRRPDFSWRADLVRDERPDTGADPRPEFARPAPVPEFNESDVDGSYRAIAGAHVEQLTRVRFSRGVLAQVNLGVLRFERTGEDLVACHDLYGHRPLHDEVALVNIHRVGLRGFAEQRPMLRFDVPDRR